MKVYSIQETYYQTGNTGMAIHLEGTIEQVSALHKKIMELIAKEKFLAQLCGQDEEPDLIDPVEPRWAKWVNECVNEGK
jgi:hypothetical protein